LDTIDLTDLGNLEKVLEPETGMILFETPTNPFLRTVSIPGVSRIAKQYNPEILVVVDNTWATPYYQKPLELGADICVYSATKYYSGHSDVMGGIISANDPGIHTRLEECRFYSGAIMDPHSAWLIRRSMQTFCLRMDQHRRTFPGMVDFLEGMEQVETVYTPDVDGHQLKGYGGILFFQFHPRYQDKANLFMKSLKLFEHGTSMASVVSAVAQPYSGSHASLSEEEKSEMGIKETLIRLCIGFEDLEDLEADLSSAFSEIKGT
jgi:cystathionine gamma-lyase/cystathionine gamma-lyase/homocysteine desulfhydrase